MDLQGCKIKIAYLPYVLDRVHEAAQCQLSRLHDSYRLTVAASRSLLTSFCVLFPAQAAVLYPLRTENTFHCQLVLSTPEEYRSAAQQIDCIFDQHGFTAFDAETYSKARWLQILRQCEVEHCVFEYDAGRVELL